MKKIHSKAIIGVFIINIFNNVYAEDTDTHIKNLKDSIDLSYLNKTTRMDRYEDSVDIIEGGVRTIDCSDVVKREETRNSSCGLNYVGNKIEKRKVYGSGKIKIRDGQSPSCEKTSDGINGDWVTVSNNCKYLPICNYEKNVVENGNCKNGNVISEYKIVSIYNGKNVTSEECLNHTNKTLISTKSCIPEDQDIIEKEPKPNFTPTNKPDNSNITSEFDDKGRLKMLRIRDNRLLRDGIYYKEITINLSKENVDQLTSAKITYANFDDWLEVKLNGGSIFSGPFKDERYILLCKSGRPLIENASGTSDLLTISDARLRNYLDQRSLNYYKVGELDYRSRTAFKNNYLVAKNNDCSDDTGKHAEQYTNWHYRDGEMFETRYDKDGRNYVVGTAQKPAFYYYNKDFNRIKTHDIAPTYNAKNFANRLIAGKNRLVTQMIVSDVGRLDYIIRFEYKD